MPVNHDTQEMEDELNELVQYFKGDREELPQITNPDEFIKKFTNYREKLLEDETRKIQQLMIDCGYPNRNAAPAFCNVWQAMINQCDHALTVEEKQLLNWDTSKNSKGSYRFIPKEDTVRRWLNKSRTPESRLMLYQIAFVLELRAYLPKDNIEDNLNQYPQTVNYLFNKIYGQRYVSKTVDELIFLYCLVKEPQKKDLENNKNPNLAKHRYVTALKMIARYHQLVSDNYEKNSRPISTTEPAPEASDSETIFVMNTGFEMQQDAFLNYLKIISPILDDQCSSVVTQINKNIDVFKEEESIRKFVSQYGNDQLSALTAFEPTQTKYQKAGHNLGKYILVSSTLKKNLNFLMRRMQLCIEIKDRASINQSSLKKIKDKCQDNGINNLVFQYLLNFQIADLKYNYKGVNGTFNYLIDEIFLPQEVIYPTKSELFYKKGHNAVYEQLRKALIISHFFSFWFQNPTAEFEDYEREINTILISHFYNPLYSKSFFDSFFTLCSKFQNPIKHYYQLCNEIIILYKSFQEAFLSALKATDPDLLEKYSSLSSKKLVYDLESEIDLNPCDFIQVQKEIIR